MAEQTTKKHICQMCGAEFDSEDELNSHVEEKHGKQDAQKDQETDSDEM
jgi:hypothetical protein